MLRVHAPVLMYVLITCRPYSSTELHRYHSHVTYYTEVWRILLLMAWLLASTHTLAYPPTHSTHSSVTKTTTPSTTSYPYALTRVVRPVYLCVLVSVAMGIPLWVSVLVFLLVVQGVADSTPS